MAVAVAVAVAATLTACGGGGGARPGSTPAVSFARFASKDAIAAFERAGLELGATRPMTRDDFGLAPYVATEGTRFVIPSLSRTTGEESGGRVMSFASQEDLDRTKAYYDDLGRGSAAFFSWTFAAGNVLVQINGELGEPQARQYEAALKTLG